MSGIRALRFKLNIFFIAFIAFSPLLICSCQSAEAQLKLEKLVRWFYDEPGLEPPLPSFEIRIMYYDNLVILDNSSTKSLYQLQRTFHPLLSFDGAILSEKRVSVGYIKVTSGTDHLNVEIESSSTAKKDRFALKFFSPDSFDSYYSFFEDKDHRFLDYMSQYSVEK